MSKQNVNAVNSSMQQSSDFALSLEKIGFSTNLLDSKGLPVKHTTTFENVCKALANSGTSQDEYDEARKVHNDNVGVASHAILATICEAQKACGENKHLVKTLVSAALVHLENKADISTVKENEKGGQNPKFRGSYTTRKSEAISSLKVTQPQKNETLAKFVARAAFMKKTVLEQTLVELAKEHRELKNLYKKAGVKKGMDKKTAKEIANMLKPAFGAIQALAENLQTAIDATAKVK
tara:strand:- start:243 stop:953 length:711 start_codon:yes stop_codon:yes gene_type:complete